MPLWFCFVIREIPFWHINQRTREEALKIFKAGYKNERQTSPCVPLSYYTRYGLHDNLIIRTNKNQDWSGKILTVIKLLTLMV